MLLIQKTSVQRLSCRRYRSGFVKFLNSLFTATLVSFAAEFWDVTQRSLGWAWRLSFQRTSFENVFRPHRNTRPAPGFRFLWFEERFRKALYVHSILLSNKWSSCNTSQVVSSILTTAGWEGPVGEGAGTRQASVQAAGQWMNLLDKLKTGLTWHNWKQKFSEVQPGIYTM